LLSRLRCVEIASADDAPPATLLPGGEDVTLILVGHPMARAGAFGLQRALTANHGNDYARVRLA
jgi:hypothetical protein